MSNKFHGVIGFLETKETTPGHFTKQITEKTYWGDVKWFNQKNDDGSTMNGKIRVNNQIEVVANQFAFDNFTFIKYVCWKGVRLEVSNVEIQSHRLVLTIGGIYNGENGR